MDRQKPLFQINQNVCKINETGSGVWTVLSVKPVYDDIKYLIENKATKARNTLPQGLLRLADEGGTKPIGEHVDCVPSLSRNGTNETIDLNLSCGSFLSDISDSFYALLRDDGNQAEDGFDTDISDSVFRDIQTGLSPVRSSFPSNISEEVQSSSTLNVSEEVQSSSTLNIGEEVQSSSTLNIGEEVQSSSTPNISKVKSSSTPNIGEVTSSSTPNIGEVTSSSTPNIGEVKSSSTPNIGEVKSSSTPNIGEVKSSSLPNFSEVQSPYRSNFGEVLSSSPLQVQSSSPLITSHSTSPPNVDGNQAEDGFDNGSSRDSFFIDVYSEDVYTEDVYTENLPSYSTSSNIHKFQNPSPSSIRKLWNPSPSSIHEVQPSSPSSIYNVQSPNKAHSSVTDGVSIRQTPQEEIHPAVVVSTRRAPREKASVEETLQPHGQNAPINQVQSSSSLNINQVQSSSSPNINPVQSSSSPNINAVQFSSSLKTNKVQPSSSSQAEEECNFVISTPLLIDVQGKLVNDLGRLEGENSGKTSRENIDSPADEHQFNSRDKDDETDSPVKPTPGPRRIKLSLKAVKAEGSKKLWKICQSPIKGKPNFATTCKGSTRDGSQEQDTAKACTPPWRKSAASPQVCAAVPAKNVSFSTTTATVFLAPPSPPPMANSGCSTGRTLSTSPSPSTTSSSGWARPVSTSTTAATPASSSRASRCSRTNPSASTEAAALTEDEDCFVEKAAPRKIKQSRKRLRKKSQWENSSYNGIKEVLTPQLHPSASTNEAPGLTEDESADFTEEEELVEKTAPRKIKKSQRQSSNGIKEVLTPELLSSPIHHTDSSWNQEINIMLEEIATPNGFRDGQSTTENVTELTLDKVIGGCDRAVRVIANDDGDVLGDFEIHEEGEDISGCISDMIIWLENLEDDISKDGEEVKDLRTAEKEIQRMEECKKIFESNRPKIDLLIDAKEKYHSPDEVQYSLDLWEIVEELFQTRKEELRVLKEHYSALPNGGRGVVNSLSDDVRDYQPRFLSPDEIKAIGDDSDGQETSRRKQLLLEMFKDFLQNCGEDREITEIPLKELSVAIGSFWYTLTKRDGTHHDNSTLKTWFSRLNVVIKNLLGGINPCNHPDFEACRTLKKAKLRKAKEQPGNGMRQHQADVIYPEEVQFMFYVGTLNVSSAWGILRTIYFYLGAVCNHRAFTDMANLTMENIQIFYDEEGRVQYAEVSLQKQKRDQGDKEVPVKRPRILPMTDKSRCFFTAWFKLCRERAKLPPEFNMDDSFVFLEPRQTSDYVGTKNDCLFLPKYIGDQHLRNIVKNAAIEAGLKIQNRKICNSSIRIMCFKNQIDSGISGEEAQALDGHLSNKTRQHYDRGNEDNYDVYGAALSCAAFGSAAILPKPAGIRLTENLLGPPTIKSKPEEVTPTVLNLQRKEKTLRMSSGDEIRVCLPSLRPTYDNGEVVDSLGTLSASYKNHKADKYSVFNTNNTDSDDQDFMEMFGTGMESLDGPPPLPDLETPFQGRIRPRQEVGADGEPVDSSAKRPKYREPKILRDIRNNKDNKTAKKMLFASKAATRNNKAANKPARSKKIVAAICENDPVLAKTQAAGMTWPCRVLQVLKNEDSGKIDEFKVQLLGLNQSELVKAAKVHPLNSLNYTKHWNPSFLKKKKILRERFPVAMKKALELAESKGLVITNLKENQDAEDKEN